VTRVAFEAAARADVRAAMRHYGDVAPTLAERFAQELDAAVGRLQAMPDAMPLVAAGVRRCLLHRFPYSVIYRTGFEPLRVLAVMHHRQHPARWQRRL
jgi:plasmid stabilization system protein ParE